MTLESPNLGRTKKQHLTEISDGSTVVNVSLIRTPKGERLELEAPKVDQTIRLDAVALESLTWQSTTRFLDFAEAAERDLSPDDVVASSDESVQFTKTELTSITNEFGHVAVRKLTSGATELLEFDAQKLDFTIRLNPSALESVTWQSQEVITDLIREDLE